MSEATAERAGAKRPQLKINARDYGLVGALLVIVLLFQFWFTGGRLLAAGNPNNLIGQNAYVVVLAIGMVMVIIAGHIDLSVGSLVAMIGAVVALAMEDWGLPVIVAILLALVIGGLVGAWQGFWVAFVRVPAFIVTLAGMLIYRGLAIVFLTGGTIGGLPNGFNQIANGWVPKFLGEAGGLDLFTMVLGAVGALAYVGLQVRTRATLKARNLARESVAVFAVKSVVVVAAVLYVAYLLANYQGTPYVLFLLAVLVLAYTFVLNRTVFGRHIYAMGGNRFAAMMSGVKTKWVDFFIFVNIGVLAAVAAIVTTARAGAAVSSAVTSTSSTPLRRCSSVAPRCRAASARSPAP